MISQDIIAFELELKKCRDLIRAREQNWPEIHRMADTLNIELSRLTREKFGRSLDLDESLSLPELKFEPLQLWARVRDPKSQIKLLRCSQSRTLIQFIGYPSIFNLPSFNVLLSFEPVLN